MFVVWGYDEAFFVNLRHEDRYRPEWFDKVEREYVREEELLKRYGVKMLDEAQLRKDMYVPIPVLHERDVLKDFLREMRMEKLIGEYHGFQTSEDGNKLLANNGEAFRQAWEEYRDRRVEELIWRWAFENCIEEVVIGWRLYPALYHTFTRNAEDGRETHRKIKQAVMQTELEYKRYRQPLLRTADHRIISRGVPEKQDFAAALRKY